MISKHIIIDLIKSTNQEFIKNELLPLLRIPSFTSNKDGILESISFLKSYLSDFAEQVEEFNGEGNPLLFVKISGAIENPLLIYGMYDTQPVSREDQWVNPPFSPKIRKWPLSEKGNKVIIARGSYNSKSPLISFLNLVKLLKKKGILPITLYIIIDGEEEAGSPSFLKFIKNKGYLIKNCVDGYYPAFKQDMKGNSILKLGYKGILSFIIKFYTSNPEIHSSYSNIVPNPALDLVRFMSMLYDGEQLKLKCFNIPYSLTNEDFNLIESLKDSGIVDQIKNKAGFKTTLSLSEEDLLKKYFFEPTFNVSSLKAGYLEKGIKNSVANFAKCKIDIRYVQSIYPDLIFNEIKTKLNDFKSNHPNYIPQTSISKYMGYKSSRVNINSNLVKSLIKSFNELNIQTQIWPLSAAASPMSVLKNELGINYITGGLGIGGNAHSVNEFIVVDSILTSRLGYYLFLNNYAPMRSEKEE